jgi:hypothetical protein
MLVQAHGPKVFPGLKVEAKVGGRVLLAGGWLA